MGLYSIQRVAVTTLPSATVHTHTVAHQPHVRTGERNVQTAQALSVSSLITRLSTDPKYWSLSYLDNGGICTRPLHWRTGTVKKLLAVDTDNEEDKHM